MPTKTTTHRRTRRPAAPATRRPTTLATRDGADLDTGAYLRTAGVWRDQDDAADDLEDVDDEDQDGAEADADDLDDGDAEDGADDLDDAEDDAEDDLDDAEDDADGDQDERGRGQTDGELTASRYLAGQRLQLPSGGYVRVRPVSLIGMVEHGAVPNALMPAARAMIYGGQATSRQDRRRPGETTGNQRQQRRDSLQIINLLVMQMVASFRVVDCQPGRERRGQVSIHAMYEADKIAIANFALKGQTALASFRSQS